MKRDVKRFKRISECNDPDRLQLLFDTFVDDGALKVLSRHWQKLNHRLFDDSLESDLSKAYAFGKAQTKDRMILFWGTELGLKHWESYCDKQRITNTFGYKNKKYGMTEEEFSKYNKSRATTLENMIARYGEESGTKKYDEYCEIQKYAGCSLEYFVDRYGDKGQSIYEGINKQKSHTYEVYLERYGDPTLAYEKLTQFYDSTSSSFVSKSSVKFCDHLYEALSNYAYDCRFYSKDKKEFGILDTASKKYYMFDFVVIDIDLIIEYNGDYYHANPKKYKSTDVVFGGYTAQHIWDRDKEKQLSAKKRGFSIINVWESEYLNDPIGKINELIANINNHK